MKSVKIMKNKNQTTTEPINLIRGLNKTAVLDGVSLGDVENTVNKVIESHGYKIREHYRSEETVYIEALHGLKKLAAFTLLIPYIGPHLPWGKRFLLKTTIRSGSKIEIDISITPWMEFFESEEVVGLSQSLPEKASDEYFAARSIHYILRSIYLLLNLSLPENLTDFDSKSALKDSFWGLLIYPLDSYKSTKWIYPPPLQGPQWCWGGFIIPELWFMWHEIWGASIFAVLIPVIMSYIFGEFKLWNNFTISITALSVIFIRMFFGVVGNKIFFARYGHFPHEKSFMVSRRSSSR
jgi:hypothetical protein